MPNTWLDLSELVAGLCLGESLDPDVVNVSTVQPPYDVIVRELQKDTPIHEIMNKVGISHINTARTAAATIKEGLPLDWVSALEQSALRSEVGIVLQRQAKLLERGDEPDMGDLQSALRRLEDGRTGFISLADIVPEATIWKPTYYEPVDLVTGGIPSAGLTILAGPPGTGKTGLFLKMMGKCAVKRKKTALVSLEMTNSQIAYRMMDIDSSLSETSKRYMMFQDTMMNADRIYAEVSRLTAQDDYHMIGVDFADLAVVGESGTSQIEHVYLTLKALAKKTNVPIVLLAQLNQGYTGGIPRVNHLRWSRLAEALSDLILLIYNPLRIWADSANSDKRLPAHPGFGWLIFGKSKFGLPLIDPSQGSIGASLIQWDGKAAWGDEMVKWASLTTVHADGVDDYEYEEV